MFILRFLIYIIFCKILFRVKYVNINLIKNIDRCVICANHISFADPLFLFPHMKKLCILGKSQLFENKVLSKMFMAVGVYPVNKKGNDIKTLKYVMKSFKDEKYDKLLIFPEGKRVKHGDSAKAKQGAIYLAQKLGLPLLPVRLIKKHPNRVLFTKFTIIFGNPIYLDNTKIKDKEYSKEISDEMMDNIYKMV